MQRSFDRNRSHPCRPWITLPLATIGPLEFVKPSLGSTIAVSHVDLAGDGIEGDEAAVVGGHVDLVAVDRGVAHGTKAADRIRPDLVLPDQIAGGGIERLHHVAGVAEIHDAVVHERHRLVRAGIVHRPAPGQAQLLDVVFLDLFERAVAPRLVVAPRHQPVAGRRIAQHRIGHRHVVLHLALHRMAARCLARRRDAARHRHRRQDAAPPARRSSRPVVQSPPNRSPSPSSRPAPACRRLRRWRAG